MGKIYQSIYEFTFDGALLGHLGDLTLSRPTKKSTKCSVNTKGSKTYHLEKSFFVLGF